MRAFLLASHGATRRASDGVRTPPRAKIAVRRAEEVRGRKRLCRKNRAVSVLAARGAEHHQILDSFEGVGAAESTVATQLGEITAQVADSKDDAGYAATAARLRVAASVFGEAGGTASSPDGEMHPA